MSVFTPTTQITRDQLNQLVSAGWEFLPTNIPFTYRPDWTMFHSIREFAQNSLDETGDFSIELVPQGLQISDNGSGVHMVDFLMRYREKPKWARGQFGEGLKIACLVCLRNGYPIEILTVNSIIRPVMVPITLERKEIPVLHFVFHSFPQKITGTAVTIIGYKGELYKDRFINKLPADVVVWTRTDFIEEHQYTEQVLDYPKYLVQRKWLYVRDIYVRDLDRPSLFSYNLWRIQLDPDRVGLKEPSEVPDGIATMWQGNAPKAAIKRLLEQARAVIVAALLPSQYPVELSEEVSIWVSKPEERGIWLETFWELFSPETVLWTNEEAAGFAVHLGKNVIRLPATITNTLHRCGVRTDDDIVKEDARAKRVPINPSDLTRYEQIHLALCWWLEGKLRTMYQERAPVTPLTYITVFTELPSAGEYVADVVRIRRSEMQNEHGAVETFIHEYAHHVAKGASDYTPQYENARDYLTYLVWRLRDRPTAWDLYDALKVKGVEPKFTPKRPRRVIRPPEVEIRREMWVRVTSGALMGTEGIVRELRYDAPTGKTLVRIARSEDPRLDIWVDKSYVTEIQPVEARPFEIGNRVRVKGFKEYPSRSRSYEDYEGTVTGFYAGKVYVNLYAPGTSQPIGIQQEYLPDDLVHVESKQQPALGPSWTRTRPTYSAVNRARRNINRLRRNLRT